jgi:hypothetical protein
MKSTSSATTSDPPVPVFHNAPFSFPASAQLPSCQANTSNIFGQDGTSSNQIKQLHVSAQAGESCLNKKSTA